MSEIYSFIDNIIAAVKGLNALLKTPEGARLSAFISAGGAIFTTGVLFFHRRAERYTWDAQRLFYLHGFLSMPYHMNARRRLRDLVEAKIDAVAWPPDARRAVDVVCGAYDQAGVLLFAPGAISPKQQYYFLRTSWGISIQELHDAITKYQSPRCNEEKEKFYTIDNYFVHFSELNAAARAARSWYWIWRAKRFWYWLKGQRPKPRLPQSCEPAARVASTTVPHVNAELADQVSHGTTIPPEAPMNMRPQVKKIVSGGQTGVDRAALDIAIRIGLAHGGYCPRGRRAEDGRIDDRYHLKETEAEDYAVRTEMNVLDSDGTLVLTSGLREGGTQRTIELCGTHGKPVRIFDLGVAIRIEEFDQWVLSNNVQVLNVAGPRESERQGIYDAASGALSQLLTPRTGALALPA